MEEQVATLKLAVRQIVPAKRERVFDAWLDEEGMRKWMCPGVIEHTRVKLDPIEGGMFTIDMHTVDDTYPHTGKYLQIHRPERLRFTWRSSGTYQKRTIVTLDFHANDTKTEIVLSHEYLPDEQAVTRHVAGWGDILKQLEERFSKHHTPEKL